jgi:hypothetical protein
VFVCQGLYREAFHNNKDEPLIVTQEEKVIARARTEKRKKTNPLTNEWKRYGEERKKRGFIGGHFKLLSLFQMCPF